MKYVFLILLTFILIGCDNQVYSDHDIAKEVSENTKWPMKVEGKYEWFHSNDHGGVDQNVYGVIKSTEKSYIGIETLDSTLKKSNVKNGDLVEALIKPSEIDTESYEIVSIKLK